MFYIKILFNLLIIAFFLSPLPDYIVCNFIYPWYDQRYRIKNLPGTDQEVLRSDLNHFLKK